LFISQSGETADTLSALRYCKAAEQKCISIVNVDNSSMSIESDMVLPTHAGPEIGVASTKAFTAQLAVLAALTIEAAHARLNLTDAEQINLVKQFSKMPEIINSLLEDSGQIEQVARRIYTSDNILYLGRGVTYPLAQEGALKLKEISYIHAEAYPAGELKHGPIALLDEKLPVVIIAPPDELFVKTLSNLRETATRGSRIILISSEEGVKQAEDYIDSSIILPEVHQMLNPVLYSVPLQLLAYHVAVLKGTDIDQPRNLAKSVTVE
jgi:glucosamine--fructose-6-phosphate aminotransferase (isomerizing)